MRRAGPLVFAALVALGAPARADSGRAPHLAGVSPISYFGRHSQRVEEAMLRFVTSLSPEERQNRLAVHRERDRLRLWHPPGTVEPPSAGIGAGLFAVAVILAAHAPPSLRPLIDRPTFHLGPSICDTGGVGIAVGGRF